MLIKASKEIGKAALDIAVKTSAGSVQAAVGLTGGLTESFMKSFITTDPKKYGDTFEVTISSDNRKIYQSIMTYGHSFADLRVGDPLLYINSLDNVGIAINQGSFADAYHVGTGTNWAVSIRKAPKIIYA